MARCIPRPPIDLVCTLNMKKNMAYIWRGVGCCGGGACVAIHVVNDQAQWSLDAVGNSLQDRLYLMGFLGHDFDSVKHDASSNTNQV